MLSIANSMFEWLSTVLFGVVEGNAWYAAHRDTIIGIGLVIMCALVVVLALWVVIGVMRFLGRCFDVRY